MDGKARLGQPDGAARAVGLDQVGEPLAGLRAGPRAPFCTARARGPPRGPPVPGSSPARGSRIKPRALDVQTAAAAATAAR